MQASEPLIAEARVFARYLLGVEPPDHLASRYADAVRAVLPAEPSTGDRALLEFACRRPWTLGPLDAAAAVVDPSCALRRRLVVLLAVLEAAPDLADRFEPVAASKAATLARLAVFGIRAAWDVALGLVLWPIATWGSR